MIIAQYFTRLNTLWKKLDFYRDFQVDCTNDAVKFQKLVDKERVYNFLEGLNMDYDQVRVQVLGKIRILFLH